MRKTKEFQNFDASALRVLAGLLNPTAKVIYWYPVGCPPLQLGFYLLPNIMSPTMMNTNKLLLIVACCFLLGKTTPVVVADESDIIYGKGVHAFFDRDYEGTVTMLLQAVEIKSVDPRPYYFLGLAYLRQEKTEEADQYFRKAAQLEYSGRALRDYAVSEALRRIQGEERLRLEQIRTEERTNARIREQQQREARYGSENAAGREAIRQLAPPNQRADLALLQGTTTNLGSNAFGVGPINPISESESIAVQRGGVNPFGEVTVETNGEETVTGPIFMARPTVAPASPRGTPAPRSSTTATVQEWESGPSGLSEMVPGLSMMMDPPQSAQETARSFGRSLGALFSRKANE